MKTPRVLAIVAALCAGASAFAAEHDYYGNLHYPKELVPGVETMALDHGNN